MTQVQELIAKATKQFKEGSIVKGRILEVRPREFLVDIGYNSEGTIPALEFDDPSAVAVGDELNRENGIPLFDTGDGYAARSMPSWNPDGTAVTFWESSTTDPTVSRLVIANLKYTTSVGPG